MTTLNKQLIKSDVKDYDYWFKKHLVYEITYKWYVFHEHIYNYVEYATEDEPRYEEACNDCICITTWEHIGEDISDWSNIIIKYVDWLLKKDKKLVDTRTRFIIADILRQRHYQDYFCCWHYKKDKKWFIDLLIMYPMKWLEKILRMSNLKNACKFANRKCAEKDIPLWYEVYGWDTAICISLEDWSWDWCCWKRNPFYLIHCHN